MANFTLNDADLLKFAKDLSEDNKVVTGLTPTEIAAIAGGTGTAEQKETLRKAINTFVQARDAISATASTKATVVGDAGVQAFVNNQRVYKPEEEEEEEDFGYSEQAARTEAYKAFVDGLQLTRPQFADVDDPLDAAFMSEVNSAFNKAWTEAKKIGAHIQMTGTDAKGKPLYRFDVDNFTRYLADVFIPSAPDDMPLTQRDWARKVKLNEEKDAKKIINDARLERLRLQKEADDAADRDEEELERNIRQNAYGALRLAGIDIASDPAAALEFADNLWKEYTVSRATGTTIDSVLRAKTNATRFARDKEIGADSGVFPTPTMEGIRLSAETNIAEFAEIAARRPLTDEEKQSLRGWRSQAAMVTTSGVDVARMTAGQASEMNMRMQELMAEEGMSQDQAISMAREEIYAKYGLQDVSVAAKLDLSGLPATPGGATSFENVSMAQRFGTGRGGGGNVNYSPSGKLQEVAGGGYVDMGKVSEIVSTYGLGGDPMLQEPGFLQFMIERDKALRAGWASEQEGLESAYARSLGRYGEVDPLQQGGIPAIPLTTEDIRAGLGAPGVTGQARDARGATMQQELTGQLGRFPTFGDYLKTVTRDQFTTGFEPKDITERTTKRVGRML